MFDICVGVCTCDGARACVYVWYCFCCVYAWEWAFRHLYVCSSSMCERILRLRISSYGILLYICVVSVCLRVVFSSCMRIRLTFLDFDGYVKWSLSIYWLLKSVLFWSCCHYITLTWVCSQHSTILNYSMFSLYTKAEHRSLSIS